MSGTYVLRLDSPDASLPIAGGKGMNLARLARAGLPVPGGFILTTDAYRSYLAANGLEAWVPETAEGVQGDDPAALEAVSQAIRARFTPGRVPAELAGAIRAAYAALGDPAVAVRSSATAEDLPDVSFAGQQDTYLNVCGEEQVLRAAVACWASLWTARAIGYRPHNGIPHRGQALAVVVQEMVQSEASGVMFTANPLTGVRDEIVVDATLGLGEALVSGRVEPDHYVVERGTGRIAGRTLGAKALSIRGLPDGGTATQAEAARDRQALPDAEIARLARLGSRIADLFGEPQDVEWAWADGTLYVLQSRPITSLFPLPAGMPAEPLQVLISFGAVQGVLDPFTPLGQDAIRLVFARVAHLLGYERTPETQGAIVVAGERLWLNASRLMRNHVGRRFVRAALGIAEPGARQAMAGLWDDPRLATEGGPRAETFLHLGRVVVPSIGRIVLNLLAPVRRRWHIEHRAEAAYANFAAEWDRAQSLERRVALLPNSVERVARAILRYLVPGLASGMAAFNVLFRLAGPSREGRDRVLEMTRGLPRNVTTEMDLALWAAAQTIRAQPDAEERFAKNSAATLAADFLAGRLPTPVQAALTRFLEQYGVRGIGEIDLGRPRWREDPTPVMETLKSYVGIERAEMAPDAIFERGAASAQAAVERAVEAVRGTRGGWVKARLLRWAARRMRALAGLRESPKFFIVRVLGIVRDGLLDSGRDLVAAGTLARPDDLFFLRLADLQALAAGQADGWAELVAKRRATYAREQRRRQVPRVLLSDGRALYEGLRAAGAAGEATLAGSPVSPGVAEGPVRVVLDPHGARLAAGEILVCHGTDPAWTPLFLPAVGLIMEVGGLMTHGSVVAREYGIPAVVGVDRATTRLKTGQRVRLDGGTGAIVVLEDVGEA